MKLERIEVRRLRLPLRHPFETSFGRTTHKEFLLVAVSADGVTGYGECVADADPYYLPETNGTVLHVAARLPGPAGPRLDLAHPRDLLARARPRARPRDGQGGAGDGGLGAAGAPRGRAALRAARRPRRDDRGRRLRSGLQARRRPPCVDKVARGGRPRATGASRSRSSRATTARSWPRCARASPTLPLMVDANSAYTLDRRRRSSAELDALRPDDDRAAPGLGRHRGPRGAAAADPHRRSASTSRSAPPDDARHALDLGACRIVNIKAGRVGGFAASHRRPRPLPRARGARLVRRACWSRASAAWPTSTCRPCPASRCPATPRPARATSRRTSSTRRSRSRRDGTIAVPEGPGIGHEIVWAARGEGDAAHREVWK